MNMVKNNFTVLVEEKDSAKQEAPLIFIGDVVHSVRNELKIGMELVRLNSGGRFRIDTIDPEEHHVRKLNLTELKRDGSDGKKFTVPDTSVVMAIKKAEIRPEHQHLFYAHQQVKGTIKKGEFIPDEKYLIDWHKRFSNYFRFKRENWQYDPPNEWRREVLLLIWSTIDEIGPAVFNDYIRYGFAEEKNEDETMAKAHKAMRQSSIISNCDESKSFAENVLYSCIAMSDDFWEAVKVVVYNEGVKMSFEHRV